MSGASGVIALRGASISQRLWALIVSIAGSAWLNGDTIGLMARARWPREGRGNLRKASVMSSSTETFPGRFAGKTAIGRASALRLAREGATEVAADISQTRLEDLVARNPDLRLINIASAHTDRVPLCCQVDRASPADLRRSSPSARLSRLRSAVAVPGMRTAARWRAATAWVGDRCYAGI